nr:hypothetical protein [Tanacetum cinerariifolium]
PLLLYGIRGGGEDQGDNGDAGGEDIASSLTISESDQAGIVSSADKAWSAAVEATTTESAGVSCSSSSSSSSSASMSTSSSSSSDDPSSSSP